MTPLTWLFLVLAVIGWAGMLATSWLLERVMRGDPPEVLLQMFPYWKPPNGR